MPTIRNPSYRPEYYEDGRLKSFTPLMEGVPARVKKQVMMDMDDAPYMDRPLVPFLRVTQDRVCLEVQRGCIRGCRFCQAGMIYRPTRVRSLEKLKKQADIMLSSTGQDEISLSSLSTSDYPYLPELVDYLISRCGPEHINISLPSLRIDAFSLDVMSKVQDVRKSSLTFAPEAGSQRLRDVINKGLTEEDILRGAGDAFRGGWNKVKLYFMLGQPTETEEDRKAIAHLAEKIAETYYEIPKDQRIGKCTITISTSFFVPKPFTPFQWAPMFTPGDYLGFASTVNREVKEMLNHKSIRYNWHEAYVTVLEGLFARGDRRRPVRRLDGVLGLEPLAESDGRNRYRSFLLHQTHEKGRRTLPLGFHRCRREPELPSEGVAAGAGRTGDAELPSEMQRLRGGPLRRGRLCDAEGVHWRWYPRGAERQYRRGCLQNAGGRR